MKIHLLSLFLLIVFSPSSFAQYEGRFIELPKILKTNGTKSQAKIFIAPKSKDNDKLRNEFFDFESIKIDGLIEPASEDSGKQIDIFVVIRKQVGSKKTFYALDEDGIWVLWNGSLKSLPVYKSIDSASDKHEFTAYSGGIESDEFNMYIGYSSETKDGKPIIHVNQSPYKITALKIKLNSLSFRETDFQLIEPDEWETNLTIYDNDKSEFVTKEANSLTYEFPVVDINLDGFDDILISGVKYDNGFVDKKVPLRWLENKGDGTFDVGEQNYLPETASRVHIRHQRIEDIDGDGLRDYIAVSHGFDSYPYPGEKNLILLGDKDGGFIDITEQEPLFYEFDEFTHALAVGDINGDGYKDIVTGDSGGPSVDLEKINRFMRILINDGAGKFTLSSAFENDSETSTWAALIADIDRDGLNDLILGSKSENMPDRIYWNVAGVIDDSGFYELPAFIDAEEILYNVTLDILPTDFNGDNKTDLILAKTTNSYDRYSIRFIENIGGNEFVDSTREYSPWSDDAVIKENTLEGQIVPFFLQEIDINLDGLSDIKIIYDKEGNEQTPHFWIKSKDYSYTELDQEILPNHGFMWLIDFDNDKDLDIAIRKQIFVQSDESSNLSNAKFSWSILENLTIDKSEQ